MVICMRTDRQTRAAAAINKRIAQNVKAKRLAKGVAQTKLADEIGVTFQQVQKYENASNRIAAPTLLLIARALDEPVQSFYEGA